MPLDYLAGGRSDGVCYPVREPYRDYYHDRGYCLSTRDELEPVVYVIAGACCGQKVGKLTSYKSRQGRSVYRDSRHGVYCNLPSSSNELD